MYLIESSNNVIFHKEAWISFTFNFVPYICYTLYGVPYILYVYLKH